MKRVCRCARGRPRRPASFGRSVADNVSPPGRLRLATSPILHRITSVVEDDRDRRRGGLGRKGRARHTDRDKSRRPDGRADQRLNLTTAWAPPAQRYSIKRLAPSMKPPSARPARNASTSGDFGLGPNKSRSPITGRDVLLGTRRRWPSCRASEPRKPVVSLDHLIGAQPYQWGYRKIKRLGGLEVQDHLKFSRHLNG
jgi:hypothetical protein